MFANESLPLSLGQTHQRRCRAPSGNKDGCVYRYGGVFLPAMRTSRASSIQRSPVRRLPSEALEKHSPPFTRFVDFFNDFGCEHHLNPRPVFATFATEATNHCLVYSK